MTEGNGARVGAFDRAYFESEYRDYERQNSSRKLHFYHRLLARAAARTSRPSILELGCGLGAFLASLDGRWHKHGFDVSPYAVRLAQDRNPDARLVVASAERIPFARQFDAIVSFDVLEHLPHPERAFDEVSSRLAPGGTFVFVVPVYDGLSAPIIRRLDHDPTHLHREARSFWLSLARAKFHVETWCGVARYLLPGGPYLHVTTRVLRQHTPAIAVVAVRP